MKLPILHQFTVILFGLVLNCLLPFVADAAIQYNVTPRIIDEELEARDIISKIITITNTGTQQVTVYPTVNNISLTDGGDVEAFLSPAESDRTQSLASWLEISRQGIDLRMGETRTIDLTIRINPEPMPGEYHALIGFGYGRNRDEAEEQVKNGLAPGTLVSVRIDEEKNQMLRLAGFIVERFVTKSDNQAAVYTFFNSGDETVIPKGDIIVYDNTGKEVGVVPVNTENVSIQPGTEYSFRAAMPTKDLFGKYKAFLTVEYGTEQLASVQDTSFFYVFPLRTMLIIFMLLILAAGVLAWYVHKRYFDDIEDDSDRLTFHIKETPSASFDHDVILKK